MMPVDNSVGIIEITKVLANARLFVRREKLHSIEELYQFLKQSAGNTDGDSAFFRVIPAARAPYDYTAKCRHACASG
ncbi:hypothetical protein D3C84_1204070 [compost metagenome]